MATPPVPQSKADIDPNFEKRLRQISKDAGAEYTNRKTGGQTTWMRPDGWDGDLNKIQEIEQPFMRTQANDQGVAAIKDGTAPGVSGDVVVTSIMIDYLACMERAFRMRHTMRRPRAMAHMLTRKMAHGQETGPVIQCALEYARNLVKAAKQKPKT